MKFEIKNFRNIRKLISVQTLLFICIMALALLFMYHCPFNYIIGISCPGCGMTRALIHAASFDFAGAFYYHPLWLLILILALGYALDWLEVLVFSSKIKKVICVFTVILMFTVYFMRLFEGSDIVTMHFKDGLIYKIFKK